GNYFYFALAGQKGLLLQKLLKALHHRLLYEENKKRIDKELAEIGLILSKIDDRDVARKYRLWIDYVKLVYESRKAELNYNYKPAIEIEKLIQKLCDENAEYLKNYVSIRTLKNLSEIAEQRFKEWLEGKKSNCYTM
ncbi:MAG: hypothetical protein NC907_01355, partial [Candidatus Omnitrophica bacterium]|nr:hypothetical protein [Candidatus Omnitrophota bacterium]